MSTRHPLPCLAIAAVLAACGPAPVPEAPPAPVPPAPSATVVSPARWLYRHAATLSPTASRIMPDGGVVHGSVFGERWITRGAPAPPADAGSPGIETAPVLLPEEIVGILPVEQRWVFFGASGRAFVAASPLGAIEEVRSPPAPVRAIRAGKSAALAVTMGGDLLRTTDGGARWSPVPAPGLSPAVPVDVALRADGAGVVLAAPQRALYTTDDGVSWAPLAAPAGGARQLEVSEEGDIWLSSRRFDVAPPGFTAAERARSPEPVTGFRGGNRRGMLCGREGCVVGAERRLGWDLATQASPGLTMAAPFEPGARDRVAGAAPLRCAAGERQEIARALIDEVDGAAAAGSLGGGRLALPVATKGEGLDLVVVTADGHAGTRAIPVFGAAPNRATVGSHTDVRVTPAGMVARRASFPVDAGRASVWISPVNAEIAWWRPRTGKVVHARLPPLGKGQMRGKFHLAPAYGPAELPWLTPDGVIYRPHFNRAPAADIFTFGDGGRSTKLVSPSLPSAGAAVRTPAGLALLEVPAPRATSSAARFGFAEDKDAKPWTWTLAPRTTPATILPIQRGDEAAFVVSWPDPGGGPSHGFLVPLRPGDDPPEIADLGLAALLVPRPRVCDGDQDPAAVRLDVDLPRALRRPILVDGEPSPALAESVSVVVPPRGPPCASEWIAHRGEEDSREVVVVPLATPQRAWSLSARPRRYGDGARTRDVTVRALRCEEAPGLSIPASSGWKGF